jgi:hypothetical protein
VRRYEVREIDDAAATRNVVANHYLASYPATSRRLGLYRRDELVGDAVFSVPAQAAVLTNVLPRTRSFSEPVRWIDLLIPFRESPPVSHWTPSGMSHWLIPIG